MHAEPERRNNPRKIVDQAAKSDQSIADLFSWIINEQLASPYHILKANCKHLCFDAVARFGSNPNDLPNWLHLTASDLGDEGEWNVISGDFSKNNQKEEENEEEEEEKEEKEEKVDGRCNNGKRKTLDMYPMLRKCITEMNKQGLGGIKIERIFKNISSRTIQRGNEEEKEEEEEEEEDEEENEKGDGRTNNGKTKILVKYQMLGTCISEMKKKYEETRKGKIRSAIFVVFLFAEKFDLRLKA